MAGANTVEIIIRGVDEVSGPANTAANAIERVGAAGNTASGGLHSAGNAAGIVSGQFQKLASLAEGVVVGMLAFQAIRIPGAIIGGLMEVVSNTEQYTLTLQNLIAVQLATGQSGEGMAGQLAESASSVATTAGNAVRDVNERIQDTMADHAMRVGDIQAAIMETVGAGIVERQEQLASALESLAESHASRVAGIMAQIAEMNQRFAEQQADKLADFQERMAEQAEKNAERRATILKSIDDLAATYAEQQAERQQELQERLTDLQESHEERRAKIVKDIYGRTSEEKAKALLEGKLTETEIDALGLTTLAERLKKEDSQYEEQAKKTQDRAAAAEAKAKKANDKKLADLQERLAKEDEEYKKQEAKDHARYDKDAARAQRNHDAQIGSLMARIAAENDAYGRQAAKLEADAAKDIEKLKERNEKKQAELEKQLARESTLYDRHMRDLLESLAASSAKMNEAMVDIKPYEPKISTEAWEGAQAKAAEMVKEQLAWNRQLAIWSPYSVQDINMMERYYMGMGGIGLETTKKLTQAMTDYGAAHGLTADKQQLLAYALAQVSALGKLQGQEFRQLAQSGMTLEDMADAAGMSIEKFMRVMSEGGIKAKPFIDNLIAMSNDKYKGAAERLALSWVGLGSTLKDIVGFGALDLFRASLDRIQPYIASVLMKLGTPEMATQMQAWGNVLAEKVGRALEWLANEVWPRLIGVWDSFTNEVLPLFMQSMAWLGENVLPLLGLAVQFVADNWDAFKGALIGFFAGLTGAGGIMVLSALAGAILALVGPALVVAAVCATLGAAWSANWGDIQGKTKAAWAFLQPILTSLATWLGVNIPAAIQTTSDFVTGTLVPGFQTGWNFLNNRVIPILQDVWTWFNTNITGGMKAVSTTWNDTLYPALEGLRSFIETYINPILQVLAETWIAAVTLAFTLLVNYWNNSLKPMLVAVYNYLKDDLGPKLQWLATECVGGVKGAFETWQKYYSDYTKPMLEWLLDVITGKGKLGDSLKWLGETVLSGLKWWWDQLYDSLKFVKDTLQSIKDLLDAIGGRAPGMPSTSGASPGLSPNLAYPSGAGLGYLPAMGGGMVNNYYNLSVSSLQSAGSLVNDFSMIKTLAGA